MPNPAEAKSLMADWYRKRGKVREFIGRTIIFYNSRNWGKGKGTSTDLWVWSSILPPTGDISQGWSYPSASISIWGVFLFHCLPRKQSMLRFGFVLKFCEYLSDVLLKVLNLVQICENKNNVFNVYL